MFYCTNSPNSLVPSFRLVPYYHAHTRPPPRLLSRLLSRARLELERSPRNGGVGLDPNCDAAEEREDDALANSEDCPLHRRGAERFKDAVRPAPRAVEVGVPRGGPF